MEENEHFFTPESVDEQVERLSAQHSAQLSDTFSPQDEASTYLLKDLHRAYHMEVERRQQTLDRAWQRIQERQRLADSPTQTIPIIPSPSKRVPRRTGWLSARQLNLVAAVLIACLLVGSLLVVLNIAQRGKAPTVTTGPTPTSTATAITQTVTKKLGDTLFTQQDSSAIYSVDWSPDGTLIASASKTVQIWDGRTGQHKLTLTPVQVSGPFAARWSPDGKLIAAATPTLQIWNAATGGKPERSCPDPLQQTVVSSSPKAFYSMTGSSGSLRRASASYAAASDKDLPVNVAWSPDSKQVAFTYRNSAGPMVVVQNIATCKIVQMYRHLDTPYDVSWSPDGKYLAVSTSDRTVRVLQPGKTDPVEIYHDPSQTNIYSVAWSPDSKSVASTSYGSRRVRVWNALSGSLEHEYVSSIGPITRLAWSHDGSKIASISEPPEDADTSGKVQIWNVDTEQPLYTYSDHKRLVLALAWSPDGKWIVSTDSDLAASTDTLGNGTLKVWQAQ